MLALGKWNTLKVVRESPQGLYLSDGEEDVLLPNKYVPQNKKIEDEIDTLNSLNDSEQAKNRIKKLTKTLNYYSDILILPAVEFEVNNGLHMLVIFNPEIPIIKIKQFIIDGGYTSDSYGFEKSDTISNWSIFDLYEEVKNYDCLVIDGHTDSDKGILNTLPKGNTRAHAFRNSNLSGVCYKSEKQRKQLENTLK
ncbi:MAG: S1 RNA-binding domain-containing protein, partial [Bacteroidota bacterium]